MNTTRRRPEGAKTNLKKGKTMKSLLKLTRRSALAMGLSLMGATAIMTPLAAQAFELRVVQGADFDTLDPAKSNSTPTQVVLRNIFNTLVMWNDPTMSELVPDLAESWTSSEDGLTWTFKLRQGVEFSDGTPFDAEAVKFNLDRLASEELGSPNRSQLADVVEVKVIDPSTVEIVTKAPAPTLLERLAETYASMSSPTAVQADPAGYSQRPVGTGPYKLTQWIPGDHLTIERNPDHFDEAGKADTMTFRPIPEGAARVIELQTGNADIAFNIPPESAAEVKDSDKTELLLEPSAFQIFLELNTAKPPFSDPRARLAVNFAIDRGAIIAKMMQGYAAEPNGLFPKGMQGAVTLPPYPYDPERAKALMAEAFPDGLDEPVVIWTPDGRYPKDKSVAEVVQGYLNDIGIKTEFKVWEWAAYSKTLYNPLPGVGTGKGSNDANMWLLGTGIVQADYRVRRKFYSTDPANLTGYNNPAIDALLDKAAVELDYDTRMGYYADLQNIVWSEAPNALTLYNGIQLIGIAKGVTGLEVYANEYVDLSDVTKP